jgi:hypothetical protein
VKRPFLLIGHEKLKALKQCEHPALATIKRLEIEDRVGEKGIGKAMALW